MWDSISCKSWLCTRMNTCCLLPGTTTQEFENQMMNYDAGLATTTRLHRGLVARSRRLLRGAAYTDCAEQWNPGILSGPRPRKVGGRGVSGVRCMSLRGGNVSTLRVGGAAFCRPLPRDSDAPQPHARKRGHVHHNTHTESAQHHSANTCVACTHGTRAHVAAFALGQRRYVVSAVRDAERRNAERSTARARDTCSTHTQQCLHGTLCPLCVRH